MQYKLINKKSKKETICIKIELKGFDYYVSDEKVTGKLGYNLESNCLEFFCSHPKYDESGNRIVATNDPNIGRPKVIDEVYNISIELGQEVYIGGNYDFENGVRKGYNKAKETYRYTEKDMIKYGKWYFKEVYDNSLDYISKTEEELLELWNNQRLVTIYYE